MAKTNFTKVESSLESGLMRMKVEELVSETRRMEKTAKTPKLYLVNSLRYDLEELHKLDKGFFKRVGLKRSSIAKMIAKPDALKAEDWELIGQIREKLDKAKKELLKAFPPPTDEELVELERLKHINKRFNVNEKWLPLH